MIVIYVAALLTVCPLHDPPGELCIEFFPGAEVEHLVEPKFCITNKSDGHAFAVLHSTATGLEVRMGDGVSRCDDRHKS